MHYSPDRDGVLEAAAELHAVTAQAFYAAEALLREVDILHADNPTPPEEEF